MQLTKLLMALGGAVATSALARSLSNFDLNDALGVAGLARRESHVGRGLLIFGGGAVLGAGAALLLAPANGKTTRKMIGKRFEQLSDSASDTLRDLQDELPALLGREPHAQPVSPRKTANEGPRSTG